MSTCRDCLWSSLINTHFRNEKSLQAVFARWLDRPPPHGSTIQAHSRERCDKAWNGWIRLHLRYLHESHSVSHHMRAVKLAIICHGSEAMIIPSWRRTWQWQWWISCLNFYLVSLRRHQNIQITFATRLNYSFALALSQQRTDDEIKAPP